MYLNYSFSTFKNHKIKTKLNLRVHRVSICMMNDLTLSVIPQDIPLDYSRIHVSFM